MLLLNILLDKLILTIKENKARMVSVILGRYYHTDACMYARAIIV